MVYFIQGRSKSNSPHLARETPNTAEPIQLRDYQIDTVNQILALYRRGRKWVLAQQPTGAGKSLILSYIVREFVRRDEPVLVIVHKVELLRQAIAHLQRWTSSELGVIANKSQFKRNPERLIQVASIQALGHLQQLPSASLIVCDEAHHCHARSWAEVFAHYKDAYILGVTATPQRIDGRGLRWLHGGVPGFQELVLGVPVRELIEQGHLSDFRLFRGETLLDPDAAGIKVRNGDYDQDELEEYAEGILLKGEIVDTWLKHAKGKRTILYPVSVELSQRYSQEFISRGISAAHIDADTPTKQRQKIIEQFRQGTVLVLCQHSIVIEGVDIPAVECVQFARPTRSLTIFFQAIGRALRPVLGKTYAIIIDHTMTHRHLPWVDEPIEWRLDPVSLPKGTVHAQECPSCNHVFRLSKQERRHQWATCPACQSQFQFERAEGNRTAAPLALETLPADFRELKRQLNQEVMAAINELLQAQEQRGYKKAWVGYQVLKIPGIGYFELLEVAKRLDYKLGWAFYKYQELQSQLAEPQAISPTTSHFGQRKMLC